MQPPPIDARGYADVVAQTTLLAESLTRTDPETPGWQPRPDGQPPDAGQALIAVFGRFAELVIERINRAPDKNFLAFLNLIGATPLPPRPARVPLTFHLATNVAVEAVVPAGTLAAAPPLPGGQDEIAFETERPLAVTQAQLAAAYASDTENDTYDDRIEQATGRIDEPFAVFAGDVPSPHQLYLACDPVLTAPGVRDVVVTLATRDTWQWQNWPVSWEYWDGAAWQLAAASASVQNGSWQVTLRRLPALAVSAVGGVQAGWLRAQLDLPLPPGQAGLLPDSFAVGSRNPQPFTLPLSPFPSQRLYLSIDQAGAAGGSQVTLRFTMSQPGVGTGLQLTWYYLAAGGQWVQFGNDFAFSDGTNAFTRNGDISFHIPMSWPENIYRNRTGRWLRIDVTAGQYTTAPQISALTVSYDWLLPRLGTISVAGQPDTAAAPPSPVRPPAGFSNGSPLDLSKDFYPFGHEPEFNDTCYLACPDALARPGAALTVTVTLTNGATAVNPPVTAVAADPNLKIAWEVCDGGQWHALAADYAFTDSGQFAITLPDPLSPSAVNGQQGYWLRARIAAGGYGAPASYEQNADHTYTYHKATYAAPVVSTVTVTAAQVPQPAAQVTACLSYNDFRYIDHTAVARTGQGDPFPPFTPTADAEPALYLGFDQPFSQRSVALFLEVEPPLPEQVAAGQLTDPAETASGGPARLTWEYAGPASWTSLAAVDETNGLRDRGLVTFIGPADLTPRPYFGHDLCWLRLRWLSGAFPLPPRLRRVLLNTVWASQVSTIQNELLGSATADPGQAFTAAHAPVQPGQQLTVREQGDTWTPWQEVPDFYQSLPQDRHYTIDPLTGLITFGDGGYGMIPPIGQNNIRLTYRTGGGADGNRDSAAIVQLKSSVPYIDGVINNQPSQGGAPAEPIDRVKERAPKVLRHRDRAVAAQDLADLALAASADVATAVAIVPEFNPYSLWLDPLAPVPTAEHERLEAGRMGVIVVPDEPGSARPTPSLVLISQVRDYLRERCPPTATLWVAGPEWIEVTVGTTVVVSSVADADAAADRATAALAAYLHPLTGGPGGKGWPFGQWPHGSELSAVLEAVDGVDHVRSLTVEYQPQTGDGQAALIDILTWPLNRPDDAPGREQPQWSWLDRALIYSGPHDVTVTLG